jgi:hypothetical protein
MVGTPTEEAPMNARSTRRLVLAAALTLVLAACGSEKGACVPRANPMACGENYTEGECNLINGDHYPGKSCADIGR